MKNKHTISITSLDAIAKEILTNGVGSLSSGENAAPATISTFLFSSLSITNGNVSFIHLNFIHRNIPPEGEFHSASPDKTNTRVFLFKLSWQELEVCRAIKNWTNVKELGGNSHQPQYFSWGRITRRVNLFLSLPLALSPNYLFPLFKRCVNSTLFYKSSRA